MKVEKFILILFFTTKMFFAQNIDSVNVISELQNIYYNLEYNTSSFDDIKKQWIINDPEMIRDFSNKFIANNQVRINGKNVNKEFISKLNNEIALGNVAVELRKRYYDNEIEYFAFLNTNKYNSKSESVLFDPILDGFYLQSIIGKKLYGNLQNQSYFYTDLSKEEFSIKHGYNFDIYLNALNSNIMFWSTTSNNQNKYLLSFFGDWGNDNIHFPGWSLQQYFIGSQLTYYSKLPPDPRNYNYSIKLGTGVQTTVPYQTTVPEIPLLQSGTNIYTKLSASVFSKNLFVELEAMITLSDYKVSDFNFTNSTKFYSIKNIYNFNLRAIKIVKLADFGELELKFGIATHDFNQYEYNSVKGGIVDLIPQKDFTNRFNHFINTSIGVMKNGDVIQHKIDLFFGYNPESYGYYGFAISVMLSNTFGFDIKMSNSFGLTNVNYLWRMDSYLVFSPIIRINY